MTSKEPHTCAENGVSIQIPSGKKPTELLKYFNASLKSLREIVLGTLGVEVDQSDKALLCLDTVAGSGIAGLQWKKYYKDRIFVILSDRHNDGSEVNSEVNGMRYADWVLNPVRTGQYPEFKQAEDQVHGSKFPGTVLLHHESFNFVYVQPNGNVGPYLDSVFAHVRNGGVTCFLSPNIASQCFRSPALIQRLYEAHVQKTDYVKEMAVRVVLSNIAKAAARHGRGIQVLFCLSAEDHVLFVVKVTKSTQSAVECTSQCRQVLHCLICEERVVLPDVYCPVEQPYRLLTCDCNAKNPGKTAVILGPLWVGGIFSHPFIRKVLVKTRKHFPDSKASSLLETLLLEAECSDKDCPIVPGNDGAGKTIASDRDVTIDKDNRKRALAESEITNTMSTKKARMVNELTGDNIHSTEKDFKQQAVTDSVSTDSVSTDSDKKSNKKPPTEACESEGSNAGAQSTEKVTGDGCFTDSPVFYYNLHRMRYKDLPKLDDLISQMRKAGYRASRTHFEVNCMRTNATGNQIQEVIDSLRTKL